MDKSIIFILIACVLSFVGLISELFNLQKGTILGLIVILIFISLSLGIIFKLNELEVFSYRILTLII